MEFKIYHFKIIQEIFVMKEGFLLQSEKTWSEVSPLPGRSRETLSQVLEQLKAIQNGYQGPLFPSVEFGLFGLNAPKISEAPVCLFLNGTVQDILKQTKKNHGCRAAKLKLGHLDVSAAVFLARTLKQDFRLRLDIGGKWSKEQISEFLSHFSPEDFEFIEDPGHDIFPFPMASDDQALGSTVVWKPMVKGLPGKKTPVILSSSYESSVGIHQIAALAHALEIPTHPLGIGTAVHLQEDLLKDPPFIRDGKIHFPLEFHIKQERVTPC
jgi:O-succinylbenzoate synthase